MPDLKAVLGVSGFSVGDELGFRQSLSNVEGNKRRSVGRSSGLSAYAVSDDAENSVSLMRPHMDAQVKIRPSTFELTRLTTF